MAKLLAVISVISLTLLTIFSAVSPAGTERGFASSVVAYQIVRIILIIILSTLLVSMPPRKKWFRMLVGLSAVMVLTWSIKATYNYQMYVFDTFAFLEAAIAAGIAAIEPRDSVSTKSHNRYSSAKAVYTVSSR